MKNKAFLKKHALHLENAKCAFSLVELLVSLIIISLLIGAFAPIITKKLKASDVTVGSFSSKKEETEPASRPPAKEDCDKLNAVFIPASMNDGVKNICVTKFNIGDDPNYSKDKIATDTSITFVPAGTTCSDNLCCWYGNTAIQNTCTNVGGVYSGCNRTVCKWWAANKACAFYAPNGTKAGDWKLPDNSASMANWYPTYSTASTGLMLCDLQASGSSASLCANAGNCPGSHTNYCNSYHVWARSDSGSNAQNRHLHSGVWYDNSHDKAHAFSARCILDTVANDFGKEEEKDPAPKSQEDCDKIAPHTTFIDKKYNDGFHNVCVTKYNVGDSGGPSLGPNVIQGGNGKCANGYCCWQNITTSSLCGGKNSDSVYSGCNRAVCQWKAGKISCQNWAPNGKYKGYWRLPTKEEADGWAITMNSYDAKGIPMLSSAMGSKGLQFCIYSEATVNDEIYCLYNSSACAGAEPEGIRANYCTPSSMFTSTFHNEGSVYSLGFLYKKTEVGNDSEPNTARSVRCVYDGYDHSEE